jgi:hypothetical protein
MPKPTPPDPAGRDDDPRLVRGRFMAKSLQALLDQVPGSRRVLPHLAALERGLMDKGTDAIGRIPGHWLPKICTQLSGLPIPERDPPLHELLNRLLRALEQHQMPQHLEGEFDPERTVVIREVSHTDFMAARAEMATTMHGDTA